jgi:hypothetical protein
MPMAARDLKLGTPEQIEAMFPKLDTSQIARHLVSSGTRGHAKSFWNWAIYITASSSF